MGKTECARYLRLDLQLVCSVSRDLVRSSRLLCSENERTNYVVGYHIPYGMRLVIKRKIRTEIHWIELRTELAGEGPM